jgi:8-oxo-dGTP pyrophosphatase MutT (NUDIX family)
MLFQLPAYYRGSGILFSAPDSAGTMCVLLGKRLFRPFAETWTIPGGRMESLDGGDYRRCAAREAFEETVGLPKLDSIRSKMLQRLRRSKVRRLHVPFLFDFSVFLLPLSFMPALDLWPHPTGWQREFSDFNWFSLNHLPDPLHPYLANSIMNLKRHLD